MLRNETHADGELRKTKKRESAARPICMNSGAHEGGRPPTWAVNPQIWLSGRTKFEITKIHIHIHTTWKLCIPAPPGVFEPDNYIARRVGLCTSSLIESKAFWEWPPTEQRASV